MKADRILGILAFVLFGVQILLIFVSWLINAVAPGSLVRSLLGNEGLRWLCGKFISNVESPILIWMLLLAAAYGVLSGSSLLKNGKGAENHLHAVQPYFFQRRHAMCIVVIEIVLMLIVMLLLTAVPHATLLNVTGSLYPSSFSESLIPASAFMVILCSITYGVMCGTLRNVGEIYASLTSGLHKADKLIPIYLLAMELYHSFMFVFPTE